MERRAQLSEQENKIWKNHLNARSMSLGPKFDEKKDWNVLLDVWKSGNEYAFAYSYVLFVFAKCVNRKLQGCVLCFWVCHYGLVKKDPSGLWIGPWRMLSEIQGSGKTERSGPTHVGSQDYWTESETKELTIVVVLSYSYPSPLLYYPLYKSKVLDTGNYWSGTNLTTNLDEIQQVIRQYKPDRRHSRSTFALQYARDMIMQVD